MTSPQEAKRLVGHLAPQPETPALSEIIGWARRRADGDPGGYCMVPSNFARALCDAAAENERLRAALRAVRASTDPKWQAQIIADALRKTP